MPIQTHFSHHLTRVFCGNPVLTRAIFSCPSARHFVAGLGSGVASAVLLQPLDLLKTRVQQSGHRSLTSYLKEVAAAPNKIQSLWRGTVPSALRTGFGSALYFTSLNSIRQHVSQSRLLGQATSSSQARAAAAAHSSSLPTLTPSANLAAGAFARTFAGFVLMPLTVIKVRYESNLYSYQSLLGASTDIYRTGGLRGFFAGFGATAVRDAPYAGMYVLFYELLKKRLSGLSSTDAGQSSTHPIIIKTSHATLVNFSSAIMAGAACSVVSNPFDAVKTRIQLQPSVYRNMYQACHKMVTEEGVRSLLDGVALRMSRKALSSALAWTVYEELIRRAERTWSSSDLRTTKAEP
ncbi:Solute carrier family 25 member 38-like protein [Colletotrichum chlorophyti]|uniref:Mitochondrial glycine transporter n=1 Tax=Colletotrichum chlorophyti TaxID=708187 RepID=A0A1Q8RZH5_9PEZI|nr:Solute carrier family 25 member 38-like protein [Colletotrichum chlorophyti]